MQAVACRPVTDGVHARGGTFFAQIWHVGRLSVPSQIGELRPLSSTSAQLEGKHVLFGSGRHDGSDSEDDVVEAYGPSHALTIAEIQAVVGEFARAAKRAVFDAGSDGVEIHGGNGYLMDPFTQDSVNTRDDEYGG